MDHYFCKEFAVAYGMPEAVLFYHIAFWTFENKKNEINSHDGRHWMYGSIRELHETTHPYLSENQIRDALKRLEAEGLILTGCYNKKKYDRTKWYTLSDEGHRIYAETQILLSKNQNGTDEKHKPIPIEERIKEAPPITIKEEKYCTTNNSN